MKNIYLLILVVLFHFNQGMAQIKFPNPVNTEFIESSPSLMLDSSIIFFSNREKSTKCYHFEYDPEDDVWIDRPTRLTTLINGLILNENSECYISSSRTFEKVLVSISHQAKKKFITRFYEISKENGEWGLPYEIMKGNPFNIWRTVSYGYEDFQIYGGIGNQPSLLLLEKSNNHWFVKDTIGKDMINPLFLFTIHPISIGYGKVIFLGSMIPEFKENALAEYYYTKSNKKGNWSTPVLVKQLEHKRGIFNVALSGDHKHLVYTRKGDIEILKLPNLLKDQSPLEPNDLNTSDTILISLKGEQETISATVKPTGKYYALLIGISDYNNNNQDLKDLDNPVNDAQKLKDVLVANYTFAPGNVRVLENPNRAEFINELENLSKKVQEKDNLLIFYAGHGIFDKNLDVGYWLPADATTTSKSNWISNSTIRDYLAGVDSKHTLLISDACFSGSIFKTREVTNTLDNYLRGDKFEGTTKITQIPPGTPLTIIPDNSKKEIKLIMKQAQHREHLTNIKGNLFCLYAVTPEMVKKNNPFKVDRRNKKFGSYFLVTGETKLFYDKIVNAIEMSKYDYLSGPVEYYDVNKKDGDLSFFYKPKEFSFQNEFRLLVKHNAIEPIILNIGSMKEYSAIFEINELDSLEIRMD